MSQKTRFLTKQARIQHWTEIIQDRCRSGKRVEDYCRDNNITKDQYYYWLREVREYVVSTQGNSIVEIKPSAIVDAADPAESHASHGMTVNSEPIVLKINDIAMEINSGVSMQLLKNVLAVIRNA